MESGLAHKLADSSPGNLSTGDDKSEEDSDDFYDAPSKFGAA